MTRVQGTLLAGLAVLAAAGFFIPREPAPDHSAGSSAGVQGPPPMVKKSPRPPSLADPSTSQRLAELPPPTAPPQPAGSAGNQDWITARIAELDDLAWFDDSESLRKILAELVNPLPEIRDAALRATREFGSRDAIPYLEAISKNTSDPLQQQAIGDLVTFLNIPTVLEMSDDKSTE